MSRIISNFTRGKEGWTIAGDVSSFTWQPTGGATGGYLAWVDAATGAGAYWQASARYHGDLSAYAGGRLSFSWFASGSDLPGTDVALTGANGVTLYGFVAAPGTDWTLASIALTPRGGWHVGAADGPLAKRADIAGVLADVTNLQIRAEHVFGDESGGLDSVRLVAARSTAGALVGGDRPDHDLAAAFGEDRHALVHADLLAPSHPPIEAHLASIA